MKTVLVVYHSQQQGNTQALAESLAAGAGEIAGITVRCVNGNDGRIPMDLAEAADAYAIGSPDYFSYPAGTVKQFFDDLYIAHYQDRPVQNKPCALFLTHGGGGAAAKPFEALAASVRLHPVGPLLSCKGAPDEDAAEQARQLGRTLGQRVMESA